MLNLNSSDKVIWEGENIPCLGVCKGTEINTVLSNLCILYKEQEDLIQSISTLNFSCFDSCAVNLNSITLKAIIQLLLDNDKQLKKLIQDKQDQLDNSEILIDTLDLKCLLNQYILNNGGDKCNLNLDVSKAIQLVIDNSCKNLFNITPTLINEVNTLKDEVDLIITEYKLYEEPIINSVLSNVYRTSSHIVNVSDTAVYSLKNLVGDPISSSCNKTFILTFLDNPIIEDIDPSHYLCNIDALNFNGNIYTINKSMDQIPNIFVLVKVLNDTLYFNSQKGYFYVRGNQIIFNGKTPSILEIQATYCGTSPSSNLLTFDSVIENPGTKLYNIQKYQSNILCSLENRLSYIEGTCCKVSCKDITIGFYEVYDADQEAYVLYFNKNNGNNIPESFEDNGSIITITDHNGKELTQDIVIESQFEYVLDLPGLDTSQPLNVNINGVFVSGESNCSVCFSRTLEPTTSPCLFCKICASGSDTDSVTLRYSTTSNTNTQTSVLYNNQCLTFKLPEDNPTFYSVNRSSDEIELIADDTQCSVEIIKAIQSIQSDTCWFFPLPYPSISVEPTNSGGARIRIAGPFYTYNKLYTYSIPVGTDLTGCVHYGVGTSSSSQGCFSELYYLGNDFSGNPALAILPGQAYGTGLDIVSKTYCGQLEANANNLGNNGDFAAEMYDFVSLNQQFGIIIKINGQPYNVPPKLELLQNSGNLDKLTGMFDLHSKPFPITITGQLLPECNCPPL